MTKIEVYGTPDPRPEPSELGRGLPAAAVTVRQAARVGANRARALPLTLAGQPDDIVEIELQDGLRIWSRVDDVRADLAPRAARDASAADTVVLPAELTIGPASRSVGGWAIKALKLVSLDVEGDIARLVADHVEGTLQPGPGLYLCTSDDPERLVPAGALPGSGPVLVFLHGTASSTCGSFAGLWAGGESSAIRTLFRHYGGRVLAFQHRTLSQSPIDNALALVTDLQALLGTGAEVHLVSHSRGGLVGELLARGMRVGAAPFTPDDLDLFESPARDADRDQLTRLSRALETSGLRVTRFVRVACPARGTTLADGRLDRYLSVLVNLAALAGLRGNPVYDGLTSLLAGVLKKRTDPRELPGLEAMMPTAPLVRMLNRPDVQTAADLHVLGGDLAGVGLFGRLKTFASDLYYREDHDLVVNTPAMLGGVERATPIRYWIDTGDQVTHFNYFVRPDTTNRLVAALTGPSDEFRTLEARPSAVTAASYRKRGTARRPLVLVLPGIMGSQLAVDARPVWMDIRQLAAGGLGLLDRARPGTVTATGLLADGYAALCRHLDASHDVLPFPYDWRLPLDELGAQLLAEIERQLPALEAAGQPLRLLAHSMGGLVVRAMLATPAGQKTWTRACAHPGARFIMLGTPNGGSHAIAALLMGREALVKKLALVDLRSSHADLLRTIAGFDGVLNLLPHPTAGGLDLLDQAQWRRLLELDAPAARGLFGGGVEGSRAAGFRWTVPAAAALRRARRMADRLQQSPLDPTRVAYVAGVADATACDVVVDESAPEGRRVRLLASAAGDGRVLWKTGIPAGIRAFYMDTVHGDLASDARHFPALVDLLQTGGTTRLPSTPPARRDAGTTFELRDALPSMLPDEAELVADALGGRHAGLDTTAPDTRITVRVVHDNLTNARSPVLVSHYKHDVIVGAEAYLDRRLDGRLTELLRMELYPGAVNEAAVVLNDVETGDLSIHPGAVVAGLGMVGDLTPGSLTATLAHALTEYGAERVGAARRQQQRDGTLGTGHVPAPLTAILVGSGDGGLSVGDSLRALLTAVRQANHRLAGGDAAGATPGRLFAQIDQVDILELYEDRAIEALHLLRALGRAPEFERFQIQPLLSRGAGGARRVRFDAASSWWQRIIVKHDDNGALEFEAVTRAARTSARLRPLQRGQVDGFVGRARGTTGNDPKLGRTLFEMLVPNDFKAFAPERQKLALILTEQTAALPWELLQDGFDRSAEPLSVATGMLRQLTVTQERAQVLRAPGNTALVVGNPHVADPQFPPLAGATAEAVAVAGVLQDSGAWEVMTLVEEAAAPEAVLAAIHDRPWRILHLAAHGVYAYTPPGGGDAVSGLVLDEGLFFTAADADQLRYVPELVFLNCCHLGNTAGDAAPAVAFHRLAANLATQFIRMGARAVIAAGWAVDDAAAKTFATSFYERMLGGAVYGDAMMQARRDTYLRHGHTNTWGAYQCYGDPSFSLADGQQASERPDFVCDSELRVWLDGTLGRARVDDGALAAALAEIDERVAAAPVDWWAQSSELCAAAARAYLELGQFERAHAYFARVVTAERAEAPIRTLEQFANCKVRWARQLAADPASRPRAIELLGEAEQQLRHLVALGETSERWSLLGSTAKRQAMFGDEALRRQALEAMSEAYRHAYERSREAGDPDTYPLANWIAADVVLGWRDETRARAVPPLLAEYTGLAGRRMSEATDPFVLSAAADALLLKALAARSLDGRARAAIQQKFTNALSRGASARVRDSMRAQFDFFSAVMETELPEAERAAGLDDLARLRDQLLL